MYLKVSDASWRVVRGERWFVARPVWFLTAVYFSSSVVFDAGNCGAASFDIVFRVFVVVCLAHRLELLSLSLHQWRSMISSFVKWSYSTMEKRLLEIMRFSLFLRTASKVKPNHMNYPYHRFFDSQQNRVCQKMYRWVFYSSIHVSAARLLSFLIRRHSSYNNTSLN